jgi:hypothetical protein
MQDNLVPSTSISALKIFHGGQGREAVLAQAAAAGYRQSWDWKRQGRKVVKDQKPSAIVLLETDLLTNDAKRKIELLGPDPGKVYLNEDTVVLRSIPLYSLDQTRPYQPKQRTIATWIFADLFCRRRDRFIVETSNGWRASAPGDKLTEARIAVHLNHREKIGVFAGKTTSFLAIDLDLTSQRAGVDEHLQLVEVLLHEIPEMLDDLDAKCWFAQIKDENAEGIHFYFILNKPKATKAARLSLRRCLRRIAENHPVLMQRALDAGLKPLWLPNTKVPTPTDKWAVLTHESQEPSNKRQLVEIYPDLPGRGLNAGNGFRLPLCRGRTVLIDRPLSDLDGKADVVSFIEWVQGERRKNMPVADLLDYYKERLVKAEQAEAPSSAAEHAEEPLQSGLGPLKRRTWRILTGYWLGHSQPEGCLNRVLVISARILFFEGLSKDKAESLLLDYATSIPNPVSTRIADPTRRRDLEKAVHDAVETAFNGNLGQADPELSDEKLRRSVATWSGKGLFLSDQSTWAATYSHKPLPNVELSEIQKEAVASYLAPLLSTHDCHGQDSKVVAVQVATKAVAFVMKMERGESPISMTLWKKFLTEDCKLRVGKKAKATKIVQCLLELGLIQRRKKGNSFQGPSFYTRGPGGGLHSIY